MFDESLNTKYPGLFDNSIGTIDEKVTRKSPDEKAGTHQICNTCNNKLKKGQIPSKANQNGLQLDDI